MIARSPGATDDRAALPAPLGGPIHVPRSFSLLCDVDGRSRQTDHSQWSEQVLIDARAGRVTGLRLVKRPLPGDLVLWDWDGGCTDHTSVGEAYDAGNVTSVDGNVGAGYVERRTRSRGLVTAFARVTR